MAASSGKIGFGTLIKIGDDQSPLTFTTIAEVFEVGTVGESAALVEFTHHESTGGRREYKHGLKDGTEISIQANYIAQNASQALVRTAFTNESVLDWQVILPDSDETFSFEGIVTTWEVAPPIDDRQVFTFNVKITGQVTVTAYIPA